MLYFLTLLVLPQILSCGKHEHRRVIYQKEVQSVAKVEEESSESTLLKAIQTNSIDIFSAEFNLKQYSVNYKLGSGRPLLHEAIIWNSIEIVEFLVHVGADPELKDSEGKTALDLAKGKAQILKLIKPGSSEEEINNCFQLIAVNNFAELKKILNQGFDPNVISEQGETALTLAIKLKVENTIRVLMQAQIPLDVNLTNKQGERPIVLAISLGLKRVEKMLRSKGAKETADE